MSASATPGRPTSSCWNNDNTVDPHYVEEMVGAIERLPQNSLLGQQQAWWSRCITRNSSTAPRPVYGDGWVSAAELKACDQLCTKRRWYLRLRRRGTTATVCLFEKIGYFDESHLPIWKISMGYRAKIYGYKHVRSTALVHHARGSGTKRPKYNSFKVNCPPANSVSEL